MITVGLVRGARGNFVSATASGHAGMGKRGTDIVCASVTILLRTTLAVLSGSGVATEAATEGRGSLQYRVTAFRETDIPFLQFASGFLQEGLTSLAEEYPEALEVKIDDRND